MNTLTLTGLQSGSDVVVLSAGTETVLDSVDAGGTTYEYTYSGAHNVDVNIYKAGYVPHTSIRALALSTADSSIPVAQVVDRAYLA